MSTQTNASITPPNPLPYDKSVDEKISAIRDELKNHYISGIKLAAIMAAGFGKLIPSLPQAYSPTQSLPKIPSKGHSS